MDGEITNNRATNLEWRVRGIAVWQVDRHNGRRVAIYGNMALAARAVGRHPSSISFCIAGRLRTSGGYKRERASREDVHKHLVNDEDS